MADSRFPEYSEFHVLQGYVDRLVSIISSFPESKQIDDQTWVAALNVKHAYQYDRDQLLQTADGVRVAEDQIYNAVEETKAFDFLLEHSEQMLKKLAAQGEKYQEELKEFGGLDIGVDERIQLFLQLLPDAHPEDRIKLEKSKAWVNRFFGDVKQEGAKSTGLLHQTDFLTDATEEVSRFDSFAKAVNTKVIPVASTKVAPVSSEKAESKKTKASSIERVGKLLNKLKTFKAEKELSIEQLFFAEISDDLEKMKAVWNQYKVIRDQQRARRRELTRATVEEKEAKQKATVFSGSEEKLTLAKSQSRENLLRLANGLKLKEKKSGVNIDRMVELLETEFMKIAQNFGPGLVQSGMDQFAALSTAKYCCVLYKKYLQVKIEACMRKRAPGLTLHQHIDIRINLEKDSLIILYKKQQLDVLADANENFRLLVRKFAEAEMLRQYFDKIMQQLTEGIVVQQSAIAKVHSIYRHKEQTFLMFRPDGCSFVRKVQSKTGGKPRSKHFALGLSQLFRAVAPDLVVESGSPDSPCLRSPVSSPGSPDRRQVIEREQDADREARAFAALGGAGW